MGSIASLSVALTANISGFSAGMNNASRTLSGIRGSFAGAVNAAKAYENVVNSVGQLRLAGGETLTSLRTVLTTARAQVLQFSRGFDVQVAVEIGRSTLDEGLIRARQTLNHWAEGTGIKVAIGVVQDRTRSVTAWLAGTATALIARPLSVPIRFATERLQAGINAVRQQIAALQRFRALRIVVSAVNAAGPVIRSVLGALAPLTRLAGRGIVVGVRLAAGGIAVGVSVARRTLASLGSFARGVANTIGSAFSLAGLAIAGLGAGGFIALIRGSMEAVAATARLSDRLGIATEKLGGLQYAAKLAGVDSESLTTGLEHMLKNLSQAASEGGNAANSLAQMGLSAKTLAGEAPDQAINQIANGLRNMTNPADRARAAVEIFGRSGQQLLPMLMQGSAGIAAATAEAQRLGLSFNRVDAAKVELANQSFVRMQAVVTGAAQTLAIQLAPFIEAAANKLTSLATTGQGAAGLISNGFQTTLRYVAELSDFLAVVEAGWNMLRSGASFAIGGILDGIAYVIDGVNKLAEKLHITAIGGAESLHQLAGGFYDTGKAAFAQAGADWNQFIDGTNSKAASRAIQDIQNSSTAAAAAIAKSAGAMNAAGQAGADYGAKLDDTAENAKKVTSTLAELQQQLNTFGMSDGQKKIVDLQAMGAGPADLARAQQMVDALQKLENAKKATDVIEETTKAIRQFNMTAGEKKLDDLQGLGINPATLEQARRSLAQLDALEAQKKKLESQRSEAKSIIDATRTPMEAYEAQIGKLSDLLQSGAIDWTTYGRAVQQARQQLEQAGKTQGPQAMQAGSAQAQLYAYDMSRGQQKTNKNKSDENDRKLQQQMYTEQYQSRLYIQQISNQLTDMNATATTTVDIA